MAVPNKKADTYTSAYQKFQNKVEAMDYSIKRFKYDNENREYDNPPPRLILAGSGTSFEPCPP